MDDDSLVGGISPDKSCGSSWLQMCWNLYLFLKKRERSPLIDTGSEITTTGYPLIYPKVQLQFLDNIWLRHEAEDSEARSMLC